MSPSSSEVLSLKEANNDNNNTYLNAAVSRSNADNVKT